MDEASVFIWAWEQATQFHINGKPMSVKDRARFAKALTAIALGGPLEIEEPSDDR